MITPGQDLSQGIGTGPFKFVAYQKDAVIRYQKNADYWGEDKPAVSEISFNFYPDPTARLLALQAGDVDLITDVPRQSASQVEAAGDGIFNEPGEHRILQPLPPSRKILARNRARLSGGTATLTLAPPPGPPLPGLPGAAPRRSCRSAAASSRCR